MLSSNGRVLVPFLNAAADCGGSKVDPLRRDLFDQYGSAERCAPTDGIMDIEPTDGMTDAEPVEGATDAVPFNGAAGAVAADGASDAELVDCATDAEAPTGAMAILPFDGATDAEPFASEALDWVEGLDFPGGGTDVMLHS